MTSTLQLILEIFENTSQPLTLGEMAQALGMEQGMLESMIEYWVRKGRIRESDGSAVECTLCEARTDCPFVVKLPRRYELASGESRQDLPAPPCSCCG